MHFDIRGKMPLFIGICLVMILLWYMLLYTPQKNDLKRIQEEQRLIQTQYNRLLENSSLAMFDSAKKLEISKKCIEILNNLPHKEDIASALAQVIDIGQGKDIRIISINPNKISFSDHQDTEPDAELEKMAFDMILEGNFLNISQYLFDLMNLPFFVGYRSIEIEASKEIYPKTKAQITCILLFLNNVKKEPKTS
ncbi:MAG: type 4a pilus biogenesis protein PilO [bacterium]